MNKNFVLLALGIFLILGVTLAMAQGASGKNKTSDNATEETNETPKGKALGETNMTYGQCVSEAAKLKNECFSTAKTSRESCVNGTSSDKNAARQCLNDYKADKKQCKADFKKAKRDACVKIKHSFLETARNSLK